MKTDNKNIALVGYHDPIFWSFAERLQKDGFNVYWVNSDPVSSQRLRSLGIPDSNICDVLEGEYLSMTHEECIAVLKEYEQASLPTANSIVFMDQDLRHAAYLEALVYLAVSAKKIRSFLLDRNVQFVSSGRDTALQMMTMLVCKKLDIFWGCVTRVKLPKEWFGFSPTHQGDRFYKMRPVEKGDYDFAKTWLEQFRSDASLKPLAKLKIKGFGSMAVKHLKNLIPGIIMQFKYGMSRRRHRKVPGTSMSRYFSRYWTIFRNYSYYRFLMKFDQPGDEPFILYGLHRQPESSIDVRGAFFDDQLTLIKQIVRSMPVTHKLYVKVHFSDVAGQSPAFYRTLHGYPGVRLIDPDVNSRDLIRRASVIITNVGAMGQEGGYWGRPVIAMSKMFWCDLPTVRYCGAPSELPNLIRSMIESPPADDLKGVVEALAKYIADNVHCDPCQAWLDIAFSDGDLKILSQAYNHVYTLCADRTSSVLETVQGHSETSHKS